MNFFSTTGAVILLLGTAILTFLLSFITAKKVKVSNAESFFVGNRGMKWGLVASSITATELWAGTILASAEGSYTYGLAGILAYWIPTVFAYITFAFIAKRIREIIPNGLTLGSFVKQRFGRGAHVIYTLIALWIMILFTMLEELGGATFFSEMFHIDYMVACIAIGIIFLVIYLAAGIWSATITSFVQYFLVVLFLLALVPTVFVKLGGASNIYHMAAANLTSAPDMLNIFRPDAFFDYFLVQFFSFGAIATLSNYAWQRAYAVEKKDVGKAMAWGGIGWAPLAMVSGLMGFVGLALGIQTENTTSIFPIVLNQMLPIGFSIAFAVMILFAIYSTGTAYLGGMSSLIVSDLYETYTKRKISEKKSLLLVRILAVAITIGVTIAVVYLKNVSLLTAQLTAGAFVGAPFFPIVLGLFWKKTSSSAVVISVIVSITMASTFLLTGVLPQWLSYMLCIVVSLVLTVVISLIAPNNYNFNKMENEEISRQENVAVEA